MKRRTILRSSGALAAATAGAALLPSDPASAAATTNLQFRLQSFNNQDRFVRHQNLQGRIDPLGGVYDDFRWVLEDAVDWVAGQLPLVRLASVNLEGFYLRHFDFQLVLHQDDTSQQFKNDSTFRLTPGLTGNAPEGWHSFESVNIPNHFIRHYNFALYLHQYQSPNLRPDATFRPLVY